MQCTYASACDHITVPPPPPPPGDTVTPRKGRKVTLRIVQRFHFSSALKRMSAVCSLVQASQQGPALLATAKGAPEVLKEMVSRGSGGGGGGGGGGRTVRIVIHYKGNYSKPPPSPTVSRNYETDFTQMTLRRCTSRSLKRPLKHTRSRLALHCNNHPHTVSTPWPSFANE